MNKVNFKSFKLKGDMMKKSIKIILWIGLAAIISFAGYLYFSFNGVPWKKVQVAQEIEKHVEKKYNTDVEVVDTYYNFKFGNYGATFKAQKDNIEFTFDTEKTRSGNYLDYYVEALWASQLKEDSEPIIKQSFESLAIESYDYHFTYGIATDLQIKSDHIPNYKTVNSQLDLVLRLKNYWSEETKKKGIDATFTFIQELKKKGIDNIGLRIYYKEKVEEQKNWNYYGISFDPGDLKKVQTQKDVENYLIEF